MKLLKEMGQWILGTKPKHVEEHEDLVTADKVMRDMSFLESSISDEPSSPNSFFFATSSASYININGNSMQNCSTQRLCKKCNCISDFEYNMHNDLYRCRQCDYKVSGFTMWKENR